MINRKGLSGVVTMVIIIGLVIVAAGILWTVVNSLVERNLGKAQYCPPEIIGKIEIAGAGTCYDKVNGIMKVSISTEDIETENIVIVISEGENSGSSEITQDKNSGKIHEINLINDLGFTINLPDTNRPEEISVYPIIHGEKCSIVDSIKGSDIQLCQ